MATHREMATKFRMSALLLLLRLSVVSWDYFLSEISLLDSDVPDATPRPALSSINGGRIPSLDPIALARRCNAELLMIDDP